MYNVTYKKVITIDIMATNTHTTHMQPPIDYRHIQHLYACMLEAIRRVLVDTWG